MCTLFQIKLQKHYRSIYYGYETIHENERPTREEYDAVFLKCVKENKDTLMDIVRDQRNKILKDTDFYFISDYPITPEKKAELATYRQKLRDITKGELPAFTRVDYVLEFDLNMERL